MNDKTAAYLDRLKKLYRDAGDSDSLSYLDEVTSRFSSVNDLASFKEHPYAQKLLKEATDRAKSHLKRLATDREMTDEQRKLAFISLDWAYVYIKLAGGDPDQVQKGLDEMVEALAKKAGIA